MQEAVGQQQGKIVTDVWQEILQQPQVQETETQGPVQGKGTIEGGDEVHQGPVQEAVGQQQDVI